jgi:hypothetical protein
VNVTVDEVKGGLRMVVSRCVNVGSSVLFGPEEDEAASAGRRGVN